MGSPGVVEGKQTMKILLVAAFFAVALGAPEPEATANADPSADPSADPWYGYYGWGGYRGYYGGYYRPYGYYGYYGKRSADAEPTADADPTADPSADPWYGYYGYGYRPWGYYRPYGYGDYYGKRSADAEPTAEATADPSADPSADPWYGYSDTVDGTDPTMATDTTDTGHMGMATGDAKTLATKLNIVLSLPTNTTEDQFLQNISLILFFKYFVLFNRVPGFIFQLKNNKVVKN